MRYPVILAPEAEGGFHVWCPAILKAVIHKGIRKKRRW